MPTLQVTHAPPAPRAPQALQVTHAPQEAPRAPQALQVTLAALGVQEVVLLALLAPQTRRLVPQPWLVPQA